MPGLRPHLLSVCLLVAVVSSVQAQSLELDPAARTAQDDKRVVELAPRAPGPASQPERPLAPVYRTMAQAAQAGVAPLVSPGPRPGQPGVKPSAPLEQAPSERPTNVQAPATPATVEFFAESGFLYRLTARIEAFGAVKLALIGALLFAAGAGGYRMRTVLVRRLFGQGAPG